jgi:hypothetical protein
MKWEVCPNESVGDILTFLLPREYSCVFLTERLRLSAGSDPRKFGQLYAGMHEGSVSAVFYISPSGLLLPSFDSPGDTGGDMERVRKQLGIPPSRVHTCIGLKQDVIRMEKMFSRYYAHVDYFLMVQEPYRKRSFFSDSELRICRAAPADASRLFRLHEGYEKEEVLLNPQNFSKRQSYGTLQKNLENQLIYFGTIGKVPVTKAGTNALGYNWWQLGGIYTLPEYRGMGFARQVVGRIIVEAEENSKGISLFVKKENRPAISLYRRLGFTITGEYRITYFR